MDCGAGSLPLGGSRAGTLDADNISDTWCITPTDDGALQVLVNTEPTLTVYFSVFASDGHTVAQGWGNAPQLVPNLPPDTYYVQIALSSGYGGYLISNNFTTQPTANDPEPNDLREQALSLELGRMAAGRLGFLRPDASTDSYDWYSTTTPDDGALQVLVTTEPTLTVYFSVFASDGHTVAQGWGNGPQLVPNLPPDTYYVQIALSFGYGGYLISNNFTTQPTANDPEPNDLREQALSLELGGMAAGRLGFLRPDASTDSYDWYSTTTPDDGALQVLVTTEPTLTVYFSVFASDGHTVAQGWGNGPQLVPNLPPDTYYVQIALSFGYGGYLISNNFTTQPTANDPEPNDLREQALSLELGGMAAGRLGFLRPDASTDSYDWYSTTTPDDGALQVLVTTEPTLTVYFSVFASDGHTVAQGWGNAPQLVPNLPPDTYYVQIALSSGYGGYLISNNFTTQPTANDPEPNDLREQALSLELGRMAAGRLGFLRPDASTDSYDWYSTTTPDDGALQVLVNTEPTLTVYFSVFASDGHTVAQGWGNGPQLVPNLPPDTYYVQIALSFGYGGYLISTNFTAQPTANDPEPNDLREQALSLELGGMAAGRLGFLRPDASTDSYDWYSTTTPDDGALQVLVTTEPTLTVYFSVFASDGYTVAQGWGSGPQLVPNLPPDTYYVQIALSSGYGGYQIAVTANGPNVFPFPSAWNFGSLSIGTISSPKLFKVLNAGLGDLWVGNIDVTGSAASDFVILDDLVSGLTISPQGTATFNVLFSPTALGDRQASVEIPSNDPDTPAAVITLMGKGMGTPPPPVSPSISSVSPNPVTGSDAPQPFTINGNNFGSGATVTLRDLRTGEIFPNRSISSFSTTQIVINPNFTTTPATWTVEVINPGGASSGQFQFTVAAPSSENPGPFTLSANAYCLTSTPLAPAVMLTWTTSNLATSYDIYRNGTLYATGNTGTSFDNNLNVSVGQTYTYYVLARNNSGTTHSNQVTVAVPIDVCSGPPQLTVTPASLNYGNVTVDRTKDLTFTVTNAGTDTLTGSASTSTPFRIVSGGTFSLSAGSSQTVTVRFSPIALSPFNGTLSFTTNGGNSSKMVTGTGSAQSITTTYGSNSTSNPTGSFAEPVNTATGNYFYQHTDLAMPGRGLPLAFTRTLNVRDASSGPFGPGWTHSYNLRLAESGDGSVVIKMGDGHEDFYDSLGGAYQAHDPGVFNTLVKNGDGSFVLSQKSQTRMAFTGTGRLSAIRDRNGNSLSFAYNGAGNISTITDTVGRIVTLSYDANNQLASIADPLGRTVTYAYDANGRLISDTDPNGGVMQYHYTAGVLDAITDRRGNTLIANTYDANKRVLSQSNGKGAITQFAYDTPAAGQTRMTDPLGHVTTHTHDILRRLVKETDPLGQNVNTVYDANNNRTSVTDKNGNVTAFTYDMQGNVLSKTDAQGNVTTLEYNSLNDPTRIVDALGQVTAFAYDAKGNLNEVTDALGHKTTVTYDLSGQPVSVTNALGAVTKNTFNTQGNLVQAEDALGHKTTLSYDAISRRTGMTDANGHAASFVYDNNGNLISVSDPLDHVTGFSYDANNNRTGVTDPRANATAFVYDANDLLSKVTDPLGNVVQFAYDAADNRIKVTDPRGNITQYSYDAANRLTQVTDALNHSTRLAYDANGNLLSQTNPMGHTSSFAYDELNRLLNATDALGNQGFRSYDSLGRLTQAKDAQGRITQYAYDALGRLTEVTDAASGTVVYDYDALGNRISVIDPNGHTTEYSYDALNRLTAKTDPLGQAYNYSYDPAGNRISLTDAKGQALLYSYDVKNRLTAIDYPDLTQVTFAYDAAGNRIQMIDKLGTSTYVFDALNRLAEYTDAFGKTVANEYDQAGNRTALIYPDGKRVTYAYDSLNRMASVTDWLNGVTDYSYDAASKLAEVLNPNGTKAVYDYDAAERLVHLVNAKADNNVLSSYNLTLDAVGNRSGIDRIEPLAPVFTNKTQALTFDNDNRLLTLDASAVTHDPNGNLTAEPGKSFQYDFEDRLVAATGDQTAQFSYDGIGNRLAATRNGQTTRYTLDVSGAFSNVLVERDGTGNPAAYYVHGLGLISRITPSGDARYYHYDTIGSTVALTDAAGTVTDSYAYDPFGQILNGQGTVNNPFRYVGQFGVMQEGDGLQFMRARYYEAGVGRFLNKDPIISDPLSGQNQNRYSYVANEPVASIDPNGLSGMLTINVVGGSLQDPVGHGWITYKKDGGEVKSYGYYSYGLVEDVEVMENRSADVTQSVQINNVQEDNLMKTIESFRKQSPNWYWVCPCSCFAANAWAAATGQTFLMPLSVAPVVLKPTITLTNTVNSSYDRLVKLTGDLLSQSNNLYQNAFEEMSNILQIPVAEAAAPKRK